MIGSHSSKRNAEVFAESMTNIANDEYFYAVYLAYDNAQRSVSANMEDPRERLELNAAVNTVCWWLELG